MSEGRGVKDSQLSDNMDHTGHRYVLTLIHDLSPRYLNKGIVGIHFVSFTPRIGDCYDRLIQTLPLWHQNMISTS